MRIQPVAPVHAHTVEDGEVFDTEFVSSSLSSLVWFANPRQFTENDAGTKAMKVDTNLVGMGSCLARGHGMTARRIAVEITGAGKKDLDLLRRTRLELDLGGARAVESVSVGAARAPNGIALSRPHEIAELELFNVALRSVPQGLSGRVRMRVAILGPIRVPIEPGGDTKRAEEFYGRPKKEPTVMWLLVHEGCVKPGEKTWGRGETTRRGWQAEQNRELEAADPQRKTRKSRDPRKAWWCSRCGQRVRREDRVVGVEVI